MADNPTLPATGLAIAADDVGSVFYQRVKLVAGADGVAVDVSGAAPLPVSEPEQTFTAGASVADISVTTDAEIFAAVAYARTCYIVIPADADIGLRIAFGAAATGTCMLLPAGYAGKFRTRQAIRGFMAGAAAIMVSRGISVDG